MENMSKTHTTNKNGYTVITTTSKDPSSGKLLYRIPLWIPVNER